MNKNHFECPGGDILIMTRTGLYEVGPIGETSNAFYLSSERLDQDSVFTLLKCGNHELAVQKRKELIDWLSTFC